MKKKLLVSKIPPEMSPMPSYLRRTNLAAASLEWGSHRKEYGLEDFIIGEAEVLKAASSEWIDPILNRPRRFSHPSLFAYLLGPVAFSPSSGVVWAGKTAVSESVPWDLRGQPKKPNAIFGSERGTTSSAGMQLQSNYYHFLIEDLPRLLLSKFHLGIDKVFTHARGLPRFVHQALELAEVELVPSRKTVRFEAFPFIGNLSPSGIPHPKVSAILTATLAASTRTEPRHKIFVSRRKSSRAHKIENQLESELEKHGFNVVFSEDLTLSEQIALFSSAEIVVGFHGAGLANLALMPSKSRVIELMRTNYANPVYEILANQRLDYKRFMIDDGDHIGVVNEILDSINGSC